jgi:hypothetical protein
LDRILSAEEERELPKYTIGNTYISHTHSTSIIKEKKCAFCWFFLHAVYHGAQFRETKMCNAKQTKQIYK